MSVRVFLISFLFSVSAFGIATSSINKKCSGLNFGGSLTDTKSILEFKTNDLPGQIFKIDKKNTVEGPVLEAGLVFGFENLPKHLQNMAYKKIDFSGDVAQDITLKLLEAYQTEDYVDYECRIKYQWFQGVPFPKDKFIPGYIKAKGISCRWGESLFYKNKFSCAVGVFIDKRNGKFIETVSADFISPHPRMGSVNSVEVFRNVMENL